MSKEESGANVEWSICPISWRGGMEQWTHGAGQGHVSEAASGRIGESPVRRLEGFPIDAQTGKRI
jgi:hypothetical protein